MIFLSLALKSLRNRLFSTSLTILSIALSVALLLSVERTKRAAEEGFTQSISQVDLLVGARTGPLNLVLFTVFNMGSATNSVSWESYMRIKNRPEVEWTIPYSLGDGHEGFRVVGTDENFYLHYRYRVDQSVELLSGTPALGLWDVVVGDAVQKKLKYKLGDKVLISHGVTHGKGVQVHDDKPFQVSGVLKPTGTAIDQSLFISLYGMEAMHLDWGHGSAPSAHKSIPAEHIKKEDIHFDEVSAFFIRTKNRSESLKLQREINEDEEEPLLAIIPGMVLADLWRGLSQIDRVLKIISWMVIGVGLVSMLSSLLAGLNERRREMAILRSLGAGLVQIASLLILESSFVTLLGLGLGVIFQVSFFFLLETWLQNQFGLFIEGSLYTSTEVMFLFLVFAFGVAAGIFPALKASTRALKDGLAVKV